jgi:hypothetical protein
MEAKTCIAILKFGKRVGQICGMKISGKSISGKYCGRHASKDIKDKGIDYEILDEYMWSPLADIVREYSIVPFDSLRYQLSEGLKQIEMTIGKEGKVEVLFEKIFPKSLYLFYKKDRNYYKEQNESGGLDRLLMIVVNRFEEIVEDSFIKNHKELMEALEMASFAILSHNWKTFLDNSNTIVQYAIYEWKNMEMLC